MYPAFSNIAQPLELPQEPVSYFILAIMATRVIEYWVGVLIDNIIFIILLLRHSQRLPHKTQLKHRPITSDLETLSHPSVEWSIFNNDPNLDCVEEEAPNCRFC